MHRGRDPRVLAKKERGKYKSALIFNMTALIIAALSTAGFVQPGFADGAKPALLLLIYGLFALSAILSFLCAVCWFRLQKGKESRILIGVYIAFLPPATLICVIFSPILFLAASFAPLSLVLHWIAAGMLLPVKAVRK